MDAPEPEPCNRSVQGALRTGALESVNFRFDADLASKKQSSQCLQKPIILTHGGIQHAILKMILQWVGYFNSKDGNG